VGQLVSDNLAIKNNEFLIILFAVTGFYLGMRKVKSFSSSIAKNEKYQPIILKKSNSSILVNL